VTTYIINDIHIAPNRVGGTTTESAKDLNAYVHQSYTRLLEMVPPGSEIIINGDLTDSYQIPLSDAYKLLNNTANWLNEYRNNRMVWALGNHSLSKDSTKLGTEQFLGALLQEQFPEQFTLVDIPKHLPGHGLRPDVYVIPHLVNAEMFEADLNAVPAGTKFLLLHCNYDNEMAAQTLHSLNLSKAQAKRLAQAGITMILGHEHQHRVECDGKVLVVGNQFPSSIADCLGNDVKFMLSMDETGELGWVETWNRVGSYLEVDWHKLHQVKTEPEFVRVSGLCTAEEAPAMTQAIANFRKTSTAFVVSNSVKVDVPEDGPDFAQSLEQARGFDVMSALREYLTPEEFQALEAL
jgi:predicted phosphodiesterase